MERLHIPRCACRGPCGAGSGEEPTPSRQGRIDRTTRRRRKETRIEHPRPPSGVHKKEKEQ